MTDPNGPSTPDGKKAVGPNPPQGDSGREKARLSGQFRKGYEDQALRLEAQTEELERAHQREEETRRRYARLFHQAPVGYVTLDESGIIRESNLTFAEMVGRNTEDLVMTPFADLLGDGDRDIFLSRYRAFFRQPGGKRMDAEFAGLPGEAFQARLQAVPESWDSPGGKDKPGAPRLFLTVSDITELKEAHQQTAHLNALLRSIQRINQLITRVEDTTELLVRACRELREIREYSYVWIARLAEDNGEVEFHAQGLEGPNGDSRAMGSGTPAPPCLEKVRFARDGIHLPEASEECEGCPLVTEREQKWAAVVRIAHGERFYGALCAALPRPFTGQDEELRLLRELAADLALALFAAEERKARQAVERSLAAAHLVVEESPGVLFRWRAEEGWPVEYVSANVARFGYDPQELMSGRLTYARIVHPDDLPGVEREVQEHTALGMEEFVQEYRILTAGGEVRWVDDRSRLVRDDTGSVVGFQGLVVDITEKKEATLALHEERQRLATTLDSIGDGVIVTDAQGRVTGLNPVAQRLTGWERGKALGRPLAEVFAIHHAKTGEKAQNPVERVLREGTVVGLANHTVLRSLNGAERQIADSAAPIRTHAGEILGVVLVFRDVTEEYRLQEDLRFQATCLDQVQDLVLATDQDGVIRYVNQAVSGLFGISREAFLGQTLDMLGGGELGGGSQEEILAEARRNRGWRGRVTNSLPGGRDAVLDCRIQPLLDNDEDLMGLVGISTDITEQVRSEEERRTLEHQLQQAMKMEAVGRLAGGVAHDFNNLLTSILGNVELAMLELSPRDPLRNTLAEVMEAGSSAAELTRHLLAFSRKQIIEPRVLDLNQLVENLHRMLSRLIGEHIELSTELEEGLEPVLLDPTQFEQILANLAVNARDAMPDGGRLAIRTRAVAVEETLGPKGPVLEPGSYLVLEVADTGHGMPPEILGHVFEPFFTTKPIGKGTGLGLSTIYGAVTQAGGAIEMESEEGVGTTFTLFFPVALGTPEERGWKAKSPEKAAGGEELVLLVEDERLVRGLAARVLRRAGYTVLEAERGEEALGIVKEESRPIQLLVTDVVMPGMTGKELATRLSETHPRMAILFTSGYGEDFIARHGVLEDRLNFIPKPYTPNELLEKVRAVLEIGPCRS